MPVLVPHAELAAQIGAPQVTAAAETVEELLAAASRGVDPSVWRQATRCTLLLNGRNIHYLDGYATRLEPDDVVWMVVPSGGG